MTRTTTTYRGLSVREPAPYGAAGAAWQANFVALADRIGSHIEADADPTANDDEVGTACNGVVMTLSTWRNTSDDSVWQCLDASEGAAVWVELTAGAAWSGVTPSADGKSLVAADDYAAMRALMTDGRYDAAGTASAAVSSHGSNTTDVHGISDTSKLLDSSAIGTTVLAHQAIGIADDNLVEVDDTDAASGQYARFTANGIEGVTLAAVKLAMGLTQTTTTATDDDGAETWDWSATNRHQITLDNTQSPCVLTFSNQPTESDGNTLVLVQDATGGTEITWPSGIYWAGGEEPTIATSAGGRTLCTFRVINGTTYGAAYEYAI